MSASTASRHPPSGPAHSNAGSSAPDSTFATLGRLQESLFFALMQMRGQRTVRTGELLSSTLPSGMVSLPNQRNQSVAYALNVSIVTFQTRTQRPLLKHNSYDHENYQRTRRVQPPP